MGASCGVEFLSDLISPDKELSCCCMLLIRSLVGLAASANLAFNIPSSDSITVAETSLAFEMESSVEVSFLDLCALGHT